MDGHTGRIVIAYDGTEHSAEALDWAATEAGRRGQSLTVLNVIDYWSLVPGPIVTAPWADLDTATADPIALEGAARAQKLAGSVAVTAATRLGRVSEVLVDISSEADLLVIGTRGHGDIAGAVLGSVGFAVTGHTRCPVVVVRGDSTEPPGPQRPVVVGVDDSPGAEAALRYAADLAVGADAELVVVTVYRPLPTQDASEAVCFGYLPDDVTGHGADTEVRLIAEAVAEAAARTAAARHPQLTVRPQTLIGPTVGQLATAAHRAGLLVVGSRGRGGVAGLVLGSVGHGLIHSAPGPVVVVHEPASETAPPVDVTVTAESESGHRVVGGVR